MIMENIKAQLKTLYKAHAPDKIDLIDSLLEKYKGKEKQFYVSEKAKYTKKNSVTDSKKILAEAMARIAAQKKAKTTTSQTETKKTEKAEGKPDEKPAAKKAPIAKKSISEKQTPIPTVAKKETSTPVVPQKAEEKKPHKSEKELKPIPVPTPIKKEKPVKKEAFTKDVKKETPKREVITAQKDEKALDKLQEAKAKLARNKRQAKPKKKKSFLWIIVVMIVVLLLILLSFLYVNYFSGEEKTQEEATKLEETTVISEPKNATLDDTTDSVLEKDTLEDDVNKSQQNPHADEPKETIKEETIYSTADRLYAKDIPESSVFVSCFAVKTEKAAQKKIALLKTYKLKAHYYWIPDIDNTGHSFFKVVVGPFNNVKSAYPSLTTVQERINFDAYILTVK